jgi:hypothetical protein
VTGTPWLVATVLVAAGTAVWLLLVIRRFGRRAPLIAGAALLTLAAILGGIHVLLAGV